MAGTLTILEAVLMKKHSFSVEFAERFGIVEALLLDYFFFWINNSQKKKDKVQKVRELERGREHEQKEREL